MDSLLIGQIPSEMDVRAYARIKNVIWSQVLATKAEIIQTSAVLSFCLQNEIFASVHFWREYSMC